MLRANTTPFQNSRFSGTKKHPVRSKNTISIFNLSDVKTAVCWDVTPDSPAGRADVSGDSSSGTMINGERGRILRNYSSVLFADTVSHLILLHTSLFRYYPALWPSNVQRMQTYDSLLNSGCTGVSPTRKETAHQALATQMKLAYPGFQCLDNLPYSPDLVPSD
jgi:hypothetical protein